MCVSVCAHMCVMMENRQKAKIDKRERGLRSPHRYRRVTHSAGLLKDQYERTRRSPGPHDITKPGFCWGSGN